MLKRRGFLVSSSALVLSACATSHTEVSDVPAAARQAATSAVPDRAGSNHPVLVQIKYVSAFEPTYSTRLDQNDPDGAPARQMAVMANNFFAYEVLKSAQERMPTARILLSPEVIGERGVIGNVDHLPTGYVVRFNNTTKSGQFIDDVWGLGSFISPSFKLYSSQEVGRPILVIDNVPCSTAQFRRQNPEMLAVGDPVRDISRDFGFDSTITSCMRLDRVDLRSFGFAGRIGGVDLLAQEAFAPLTGVIGRAMSANPVSSLSDSDIEAYGRNALRVRASSQQQLALLLEYMQLEAPALVAARAKRAEDTYRSAFGQSFRALLAEQDVRTQDMTSVAGQNFRTGLMIVAALAGGAAMGAGMASSGGMLAASSMDLSSQVQSDLARNVALANEALKGQQTSSADVLQLNFDSLRRLGLPERSNLQGFRDELRRGYLRRYPREQLSA
jgi:hypothetical protein